MEISISTLSDVSHVSRWSDILNHVFISAVEAANNERAQERKKEKKKGSLVSCMSWNHRTRSPSIFLTSAYKYVISQCLRYGYDQAPCLQITTLKARW